MEMVVPLLLGLAGLIFLYAVLRMLGIPDTLKRIASDLREIRDLMRSRNG